jgi:hypothetical protein
VAPSPGSRGSVFWKTISALSASRSVGRGAASQQDDEGHQPEDEGDDHERASEMAAPIGPSAMDVAMRTGMRKLCLLAAPPTSDTGVATNAAANIATAKAIDSAIATPADR